MKYKANKGREFPENDFMGTLAASCCDMFQLFSLHHLLSYLFI